MQPNYPPGGFNPQFSGYNGVPQAGPSRGPAAGVLVNNAGAVARSLTAEQKLFLLQEKHRIEQLLLQDQQQLEFVQAQVQPVNNHALNDSPILGQHAQIPMSGAVAPRAQIAEVPMNGTPPLRASAQPHLGVAQPARPEANLAHTSLPARAAPQPYSSSAHHRPNVASTGNRMAGLAPGAMAPLPPPPSRPLQTPYSGVSSSEQASSRNTPGMNSASVMNGKAPQVLQGVYSAHGQAAQSIQRPSAWSLPQAVSFGSQAGQPRLSEVLAKELIRAPMNNPVRTFALSEQELKDEWAAFLPTFNKCNKDIQHALVSMMREIIRNPPLDGKWHFKIWTGRGVPSIAMNTLAVGIPMPVEPRTRPPQESLAQASSTVSTAPPPPPPVASAPASKPTPAIPSPAAPQTRTAPPSSTSAPPPAVLSMPPVTLANSVIPMPVTHVVRPAPGLPTPPAAPPSSAQPPLKLAPTPKTGAPPPPEPPRTPPPQVETVRVVSPEKIARDLYRALSSLGLPKRKRPDREAEDAAERPASRARLETPKAQVKDALPASKEVVEKEKEPEPQPETQVAPVEQASESVPAPSPALATPGPTTAIAEAAPSKTEPAPVVLPMPVPSETPVVVEPPVVVPAPVIQVDGEDLLTRKSTPAGDSVATAIVLPDTPPLSVQDDVPTEREDGPLRAPRPVVADEIEHEAPVQPIARRPLFLPSSPDMMTDVSLPEVSPPVSNPGKSVASTSGKPPSTAASKSAEGSSKISTIAAWSSGTKASRSLVRTPSNMQVFVEIPERRDIVDQAKARAAAAAAKSADGRKRKDPIDAHEYLHIDLPCHWADCDAMLDCQRRLENHLKLKHLPSGGAIPVCRWKGCRVRPFASSKLLREHVMDAHVSDRFPCPYEGCNVKGTVHLIEAHLHTTQHPKGKYTDRLKWLPTDFSEPVVIPAIRDLSSPLPVYAMYEGIVRPASISEQRHAKIGRKALSGTVCRDSHFVHGTVSHGIDGVELPAYYEEYAFLADKDERSLDMRPLPTLFSFKNTLGFVLGRETEAEEADPLPKVDQPSTSAAGRRVPLAPLDDNSADEIVFVGMKRRHLAASDEDELADDH